VDGQLLYTTAIGAGIQRELVAAMRIHHLNCMTFHLGLASVTHCLLIETADGIVLVDGGLGLRDYEEPSVRM